MRKVGILFILIIAGCKDYTNSPYMPIPKDYTPRTPHQKLTKSIYTGESFTGDGFSKDLNTFMEGPTSNFVLSANNSPSSGCGLPHYEDREVDSDTEQMNGFPLSISDKTSGSIKGEPQVMWDECKGIRSNYDDGDQKATCKKRKVSKEYINFFDDNFAKCVQVAAKGFKAGGEGDVEKIQFSHAGIAGDPRHSNRSYHSVNRAMDIRTISFIQDGKTVSLKVSDQKKSPSKEFFEQFRKCWSDQIVAYKNNCPGSSNKGSIGHEDKDHQHHLHLSLPYCPRTKNGSTYYYK